MRSLSLLCVSFALVGCEGAPPTPTAQPSAAASDDGARRFGELRARVIGEGDGPVVILLHGWGAPGDDLVGLAERLDAPTARFVVPEALLERPGGGRMWWPLDPDRLREGADRDLSDETPPGMAAARAKVIALVHDVRRTMRVSLSHIVIAGFSQGAMLAVDVALHLEENVGGVAALSGTLVSEDAWVARARDRRGLRVLVAHGRNDTILPFRMAEQLRDALAENGAEVRWVANDGGHTIPEDVTAALEQLIAEVAR